MRRFNDVELVLASGLGRELALDARGEIRIPRPKKELSLAAAHGTLHGEATLRPDDAECVVELKAYHPLAIEVMREGIKQKIVHPKIVMKRLPGQIDKQLVDDPKKSPFFDPYKKVPASIPAAERDRIVTEGENQIRTSVIPALKKLREFFVAEYLPACSDQIGAWQRPRGDDSERPRGQGLRA